MIEFGVMWGLFWFLAWGSLAFLFYSERPFKAGPALGLSLIGLSASVMWLFAVYVASFF